MYIIKRKIERNRNNRIYHLDKKSRIANEIKIDGLYKMFSIKNGVKQQVGEEHNIITDACLNRVASTFICCTLSFYFGIDWLAIGDDNTPVASTDTTLGNELFRTQYVSRSNTDNVTKGDFYVTDTDFSGDIEELGIFGGLTASTTADSGGLLSHVLWDYTKSSSEELVVEYELTVN